MPAFFDLSPALRAPIAIALGAIPGALSRYYLSVLTLHWFGNSFPIGTLLANLTGSLIMGCFVTYSLDRSLTSPELRLLVAVGFLGSYTTFSSYTLETSTLWQSEKHWRSIGYWLGSAILGVICLELGRSLAKRLP